MLTPPIPNEGPGGTPVSAWRRIQSGMVVTSATGTPRTGVLASASSSIVTGTADLAMTYQIGPFVAATSRDGVGVEFVGNDATETVSTIAAPGSNSRIDVIWVRCRFPSLTDAGQTTPLFGVTQGVANASPSKPSIPAGALELATAVVTSSDLTTQTTVITQTFPWTAMAGGVVPLRSAAEQSAWAPGDGSYAHRLDLGVLLARRGGVWKLGASVTRTTGVVATDNDGIVTITHNLGVTPDAVVPATRNHPTVDANTLAFRPVLWGEPGPTSFQVRWINTGSNTYLTTAQQVRFAWTAQ